MRFEQGRFPGTSHLRAWLLVTAAALVGAFASTAHSQPADADPPGRVARVADLNGQVWLYSPDAGEWVSAVRNRPLTTGDRIATDPGARAELQLGSTSLRLDGDTELEVVALDDDRAALQLHNGSVIARVRDVAGAGQLELSTDEGRFIVPQNGSYRFDRNNGHSFATVYSGRAQYEGPNSGLPLNPGQRSEFWIDAGGAAQYSLGAPVGDAFAAWNNDRDRRVATSISATYVSPEMAGADELDRYGRWEQSPDYGAIWIPTAVAVDWAPYSHGHWTWVRPWGWTWVDDAPWGFAPFHYGRWVYVRNNWCWTPGTRVIRPVYAPALVAWVGGPQVNVSVSIGGRGPSVGWFPLAPREVYVPSYHVSQRYARSVNITNVTNVTVINNVFKNPQGPREFENRRFPRAITVVPAAVMTERRPVAPVAAQMRNETWVRDLAKQPGRSTAMLAPPVAAPVLPARNADPRAVRMPPGATPGSGDRSAIGRPGFSGRDRADDSRRPGGGRDAERPDAPQAQRPPAQAGMPAPGPAAVAPANPAFQRPGQRPAPSNDAARPEQVNPNNPGNPGNANADRRPDMRIPERPRPAAPRDNSERPPISETPRPAPPAAPAAVAPPPRPAVAPQEMPSMRPQPVQRDGEQRRGDERRGDDRRAPPPRPEAPPAAEMRQPRVERPAVVAPPRPAEQPQAPRPVEVQRAAPPPAAPPPAAAPPEVRRPESPRLEQKRNESRDPRDPPR